MTYHLNCPEETQKLGNALGDLLRPGDTVLLTGDLGAGKSVLVRACARAMGVSGPMPSPTFTIMQPYPCRGGTLCHYDLYRLEDEEEFYAVGLDEPLGRDVCFIEWPMEELEYPDPLMRIAIFRQGGENTRRMEISWQGFEDRREAFIRQLKQWEVQGQ